MAISTIEKEVAVMEDECYKNVSLVNGYVSIINDESKQVYLKKIIFGTGLFSSYWAIHSDFLYGSNI